MKVPITPHHFENRYYAPPPIAITGNHLTLCVAAFSTAFLAVQILMSVIEIISSIGIVACSTACVTSNIITAVIMAIFDMALQYVEWAIPARHASHWVIPGALDMFMTASMYTNGSLKGYHHLLISMITTITHLSIHSGGSAAMLVLIIAATHTSFMTYWRRARHIQRAVLFMLAIVPHTYGQMATWAPKISGLSRLDAPPGPLPQQHPRHPVMWALQSLRAWYLLYVYTWQLASWEIWREGAREKENKNTIRKSPYPKLIHRTKIHTRLPHQRQQPNNMSFDITKCHWQSN